MNQFSIIVALYNSDPYKTRMTLASILQQELIDFEIIVTDDGSLTDPMPDIKDYFDENCFNNYKLIRNQVNLGTVKNLYGAIRKAGGEYIKMIGAGDLLYNRTTLKEVYDFMKTNQYHCCFGRMKSFSFINGYDIIPQKFHAPKYHKEFMRTKIKRDRVIKDMLLNGNWIYGSTMFFERNKLLRSFQPLLGRVIYTEDVFQLMIFLQKEYMHYYDGYVIWYEVGYGISNSGNVKFIRAIRTDQENFISYVESKCPKNKVLLKAIQDRRNEKAGMMDMTLRKLLEVKRWEFCLWREEHSVYKSTIKGFLDTPKTFKI